MFKNKPGINSFKDNYSNSSRLSILSEDSRNIGITRDSLLKKILGKKASLFVCIQIKENLHS